MIDELLVNGEPLENKARIIEDWDSARGIGKRRTANIIVPNRDGEIWVPKSREAKIFTVAMVILGCDPQTGKQEATLDARRRRFNANWRDFVRLLAPSDAPLDLTRVYGYPGGVTERQTATAEIDGEVNPVMLAPDAARIAVSFKLLDGIWFGETLDTQGKLQPTSGAARADIAQEFALTAPGDAVTWEMEIILSDSPGAQRLTNQTTGDWVEFAGPTTVPVTLDVPNYRAAQEGQSVVSQISTGDTGISPYWMTLAPGANRLLLSSGKVQIRYRGAYS